MQQHSTGTKARNMTQRMRWNFVKTELSLDTTSAPATLHSHVLRATVCRPRRWPLPHLMA